MEFFSGVLIPGFVNAHCHSELSYLRGKIERRRGFAGFADSIARVRHEATPEERLASSALLERKNVSGGYYGGGGHLQRGFDLPAEAEESGLLPQLYRIFRIADHRFLPDGCRRRRSRTAGTTAFGHTAFDLFVAG